MTAILSNPADVALDTSGRVVVADRWNNKVSIYESTDYVEHRRECPARAHRAQWLLVRCRKLLEHGHITIPA